MKFNGNVELGSSGAKVKNAIFEEFSNDPTVTSPENSKGRIYFNTVSKEFKFYNGVEWNTLGSAPIELVDSLMSTDPTKALSANQGKILDDKITAIPTTDLTPYRTAADEDVINASLQTAIDNIDTSDKVSKSGDVMTGGLTVQPNNSAIYHTISNSGFQAFNTYSGNQIRSVVKGDGFQGFHATDPTKTVRVSALGFGPTENGSALLPSSIAFNSKYFGASRLSSSALSFSKSNGDLQYHMYSTSNGAWIRTNQLTLFNVTGDEYVPTDDESLVHKKYVDNQILAATGASDDNHITSGTWDEPTRTLTLSHVGQADTVLTIGDEFVELVDNLTSTDTTKALSANQGKILDDKITAIPTTDLTPYRTAADEDVINAGLQTAIDDKVSKTGDTMSGNLNVVDASIIVDGAFSNQTRTVKVFKGGNATYLKNQGITYKGTASMYIISTSADGSHSGIDLRTSGIRIDTTDLTTYINSSNVKTLMPKKYIDDQILAATPDLTPYRTAADEDVINAGLQTAIDNIDTSDKVSKTGDTMTGALTVASANGTNYNTISAGSSGFRSYADLNGTSYHSTFNASGQRSVDPANADKSVKVSGRALSPSSQGSALTPFSLVLNNTNGDGRITANDILFRDSSHSKLFWLHADSIGGHINSNQVKINNAQGADYVPTDDKSLVHKKYVDDQILAATGASDDNHITSGTWDEPTRTLTLSHVGQADTVLTIGDEFVELVDNLTSTDTTKALTANQGKILDDKIFTAHESWRSGGDLSLNSTFRYSNVTVGDIDAANSLTLVTKNWSIDKIFIAQEKWKSGGSMASSAIIKYQNVTPSDIDNATGDPLVTKAWVESKVPTVVDLTPYRTAADEDVINAGLQTSIDNLNWKSGGVLNDNALFLYTGVTTAELEGASDRALVHRKYVDDAIANNSVNLTAYRTSADQDIITNALDTRLTVHDDAGYLDTTTGDDRYVPLQGAVVRSGPFTNNNGSIYSSFIGGSDSQLRIANESDAAGTKSSMRIQIGSNWNSFDRVGIYDDGVGIVSGYQNNSQDGRDLKLMNQAAGGNIVLHPGNGNWVLSNGSRSSDVGAPDRAVVTKETLAYHMQDYVPTSNHGVKDVAGLAALTANLGDSVFVSDEVGGSIPAFYDGTNWRRTTDRAVVSS